MKVKKVLSVILSLTCMLFIGLGIYAQSPIEVNAESPTVTVTINQNANNVAWDDTQTRTVLNIVVNATGETVAANGRWEHMGSVIGNGVTMDGTGANLNYFGYTGDTFSFIYQIT